MSIHTENFRRAAIATAAAWAHAADAIDNARWAARSPREVDAIARDAIRAIRAAKAAMLESMDATKFADAAYLESNDCTPGFAAASAHEACTIAMQAADAAAANAEANAKNLT